MRNRFVSLLVGLLGAAYFGIALASSHEGGALEESSSEPSVASSWTGRLVSPAPVRTYQLTLSSGKAGSIYFNRANGELVMCFESAATCSVKVFEPGSDVIPSHRKGAEFLVIASSGSTEVCEVDASGNWLCSGEPHALEGLLLSGGQKRNVSAGDGAKLTCALQGSELACTAVRASMPASALILIGRLERHGALELVRATSTGFEVCKVLKSGEISNCKLADGLHLLKGSSSVSLSHALYGSKTPLIVALNGNFAIACKKTDSRESDVRFSCSTEDVGIRTDGLAMHLLTSNSGRSEAVFLRSGAAREMEPSIRRMHANSLVAVNQSIQRLSKSVSSARSGGAKLDEEDEWEYDFDDYFDYPLWFEACFNDECDGFWGGELREFFNRNERQCVQCDIDKDLDGVDCDYWVSLGTLGGGAVGLGAAVYTSIVTGGIGAGAAATIWVTGLSGGAAIGVVLANECKARAIARWAQCKQTNC